MNGTVMVDVPTSRRRASRLRHRTFRHVADNISSSSRLTFPRRFRAACNRLQAIADLKIALQRLNSPKGQVLFQSSRSRKGVADNDSLSATRTVLHQIHRHGSHPAGEAANISRLSSRRRIEKPQIRRHGLGLAISRELARFLGGRFVHHHRRGEHVHPLPAADLLPGADRPPTAAHASPANA